MTTGLSVGTFRVSACSTMTGKEWVFVISIVRFISLQTSISIEILIWVVLSDYPLTYVLLPAHHSWLMSDSTPANRPGKLGHRGFIELNGYFKN